jgi:hypothetical protein
LDDNKKTAERGGEVTFSVQLERGYKISDIFGASGEWSDNYSFSQTVTITDIKYKTSVQLETEEMTTTNFTVNCADGGSVEIASALGQVSDGVYYVDDQLTLTATAEKGYRFYCWSTGNFLSAGGKFYGYSSELALDDIYFNDYTSIYANYKDTNNTAYMIYYNMGDDVVLEQDCYAMVLHHPRANTLTAKNLYDGEYYDSYINGQYTNYFLEESTKMLIGWETEDGEYIGLGSRVAVSSDSYINLYPIWKEYFDEEYFTVNDDGAITAFCGQANTQGEVVIPNKVNGQTVTSIGSRAFEGCNATTYYLPNTIDTVEENAFYSCTSLTDFYMSDNIMQISDSSFTGCENFTTLHVNAYFKPRLRLSWLASKVDQYDTIINNYKNNIRQVVVLGGSSVRFGYNTTLANSLLNNEYSFVNLGNEWIQCGFMQYEVFGKYLQDGDIYIHAPEPNNSYYGTTVDDNIYNSNLNSSISVIANNFYLIESNWQLLSNVTVNLYSNLISTFSEFNNLRINYSELEYSDYLQDGNGYAANEYGDTSRPQSNRVDWNYGTADFNFFTDKLITNVKENIFQPLVDKGVKCFFTFAPMCIVGLKIKYGSDENLNAVADEYTQRVKDILVTDSIKVLLTQQDTFYESECFYDSMYHLGSPTREEHTTKVINALIEELKK